jgi:hypothetical protein
MRNFSGIHTGPSVTSFPSAPTKTNTASNLPQWQQDYNARAAELRELQSENGGTGDTITKTAFPKTFNDLTIAQQNEIKRQGYAQYKDARVYVPIEIETKKQTSTTTNSNQSPLCIAARGDVRTCITNFDKAEKSAETNFFHDKNDTNKANLKSAIVDAIMSACKCTEGNRLQNQLRQMFGVTCTATDQTNAETTAQTYIDSL